MYGTFTLNHCHPPSNTLSTLNGHQLMLMDHVRMNPLTVNIVSKSRCGTSTLIWYYTTLLYNLSKNCKIVVRSMPTRHTYLKKLSIEDVVGLSKAIDMVSSVDDIILNTATTHALKLMEIKNTTLLMDFTKRNSSILKYDNYFFRKLMDNGNIIHLFCEDDTIVESLPPGFSILEI